MYGKGVLNPSYRQRTAHHAMLLGGMAAITSALLVIGNKQTAPDIELRHIEDMKRSLEQVISPDIHNNDLLKDIKEIKVGSETKTVYIAKSDDKVVAVAFNSSAIGYAGPINIVVGINRDGQLLGTRVLSHNETPGLGDKIEPEKDSWIFRFDGLSLGNPGESQWKVKKDGGYFDQFTGATITPRAVIKAVKSSLDLFSAHKKELLVEKNLQSLPEKDKSPSPKPDKLPQQKADKQQTVLHKNAISKGKSDG